MVLNAAAYFGIGMMIGLAYSIINHVLMNQSNKRHHAEMLDERRIMRNQMIQFMEELQNKKK